MTDSMAITLLIVVHGDSLEEIRRALSEETFMDDNALSHRFDIGPNVCIEFDRIDPAIKYSAQVFDRIKEGTL